MVSDADVLSADSVLGQSVFRSRAILGQVIQCGLIFFLFFYAAVNHICSIFCLNHCLSLVLTSFDADVRAADLARLVLGGAKVVVVMDVAVVRGGRERVQLEGAVGVHMADVGHVVDVVASGQVPAQYGAGGAPCRTGQGHPH